MSKYGYFFQYQKKIMQYLILTKNVLLKKIVYYFFTHKNSTWVTKNVMNCDLRHEIKISRDDVLIQIITLMIWHIFYCTLIYKKVAENFQEILIYLNY